MKRVNFESQYAGLRYCSFQSSLIIKHAIKALHHVDDN